MDFGRGFDEGAMRTSFGGLILDTATRQLLRGGEPVPLSPKAFELLALLVANRPRAVAKNELHDRLWPDTAVSDTNLAGLVAEIRRATGDDARTPRFVRTVQRFGYAFSGTAVPDAGPPDEGTASSPCWLADGRGRINLAEGENLLGRDGDPARFESATVSRRHARVVVEGTRAFIEDLGSKNGTFLRGRRIRSREMLVDGDTIALGSVSLVFHGPAVDGTTRTWKPGRRP